MRHVFGFLFGLIAAPALLGGTAWSVERAGTDPFTFDTLDGKSLITLAAIAGCGILAGLVLASRLSPLASLLCAIVFLAPAVLYMVNKDTLADLAPDNQIGRGILILAVSGIGLMLGLAFLVATLMPNKWRKRRPVTPPATSPTYGTPEPAGYGQQQTYGEEDPWHRSTAGDRAGYGDTQYDQYGGGSQYGGGYGGGSGYGGGYEGGGYGDEERTQRLDEEHRTQRLDNR
jgi:hypothetical protein